MQASFLRAAHITVIMFSVVMLASREAAAGLPDWIDWNGANFLEPFQSDRSVSLSARRQIADRHVDDPDHADQPSGSALGMALGDAGIVDGQFSRRLVTFGMPWTLRRRWGRQMRWRHEDR
jgi:hypothetical protein